MPKTIAGVTFTTLTDFIVDIVEGRISSDKHGLAVEILRYVHQQRTATPPSSEDVIEADVHRLWNFDETRYYSVQTLCHLETVTEENGAERMVIVSEPLPESQSKFHAVPIPQTKAILQPAVVEPAPPVESKHDRPMPFDERFSPAEVQKRVDKIVAEAATQRQRESERWMSL
jgi:hypothetical protein